MIWHPCASLCLSAVQKGEIYLTYFPIYILNLLIISSGNTFGANCTRPNIIIKLPIEKGCIKVYSLTQEMMNKLQQFHVGIVKFLLKKGSNKQGVLELVKTRPDTPARRNSTPNYSSAAT